MIMKQQQPFAPAMHDAIPTLREGGMVIVVDDERRENEGDLIVAAEKATPENINFMVKHGRGLVCVAMEREQLARLGLSRMSTDGIGDIYRTAFMESVDARYNVTTGISTHDRAETVRVLISEQSGPGDITRPGHVFPLEAVEHGVLRRAGHTEASVDLARLAGLKPAGVICEILRDDGQMARMPELREFSRTHDIPIITIEDLIAFRKKHEKLVHLENSVRMPTKFGEFQLHMYHSIPGNEHHLALVMGNPQDQAMPLVRLHSECLTGDVFGSMRCDCGNQLEAAMQMIAERGHGVLLYMRQEGRGIGLAHKIHAYKLQEKGLDTVEANTQLGFEPDLRDYSDAAQILQDLGVDKIELLTNNPLKIEGLEQYSICIARRSPLIIPYCSHNHRYLETKKEKLGHLL